MTTITSSSRLHRSLAAMEEEGGGNRRKEEALTGGDMQISAKAALSQPGLMDGRVMDHTSLMLHANELCRPLQESAHQLVGLHELLDAHMLLKASVLLVGCEIDLIPPSQISC